MTLVVDASVVAAGLVDNGRAGSWAMDLLGSDHLAAPHLLPAEVTNVLLRALQAGHLSADTAALAQADLADLPVEYFDYAPFAERVWSLRANVSSYDGWYVALAEALHADLATLDRRLAATIGPGCAFVLPPGLAP